MRARSATGSHSGLDPATPNFNYQTAGGYGYDNNLATNASGATMLAWFSDTPPGIRAQAVGADGAPAGAPMTMPGTQVMVGGPELSRTPIVARPKNGGFYIARAVGYPTANRVRVWRVGASSAALLAKTDAQRRDGDLDRRQGPPVGRVVGRHVRRQARLVVALQQDAVRFGEPVDVGAVKDAHSRVLARHQRDRVGRRRRARACSASAPARTPRPIVTRVLPGLTLAGKRAGDSVTFTVTDAGEPVKSAKVKAGGKSGTTDSKGKVKLTLKSKTASRATKSGYEPATLKAK